LTAVTDNAVPEKIAAGVLKIAAHRRRRNSIVLMVLMTTVMVIQTVKTAIAWVIRRVRHTVVMEPAIRVRIVVVVPMIA
jgi:hypothetical protein